jgi:GNAT superfamily N-acetyltransferase
MRRAPPGPPETAAGPLAIRRAGEDAAALSKLARETYAAAFGSSLKADDLAHLLEQDLSPARFRRASEDDIVLIAEVRGGIVGFLQCGAVRLPAASATPADMERRRLYVHPSRNAGIGGRLLQAALAHARIGAARSLYLDVWERNADARRFYERHGFRVIGAHRPAFASGPAADPDLIMVRRGG